MKSTTALLIAAVVVGTLLRGYQAGESLWLDELHTSWSVHGSLSEVTERAIEGNQSPLYFWLAWFFARLPLPPEIALRLPSLLAGCALPAAMYWLAKKLIPASDTAQENTVPLLAAWLTAIDPIGIFYSQEARPYALVQLISIIHIGQLLMILERRAWRPRLLWIISGALLVHLHYTAGLLVVAEIVAVLCLALIAAMRAQSTLTVAPSDEVLDLLVTCWLDLGLLIVLLLPAVPGMLAVAERRGNWDSFVRPQPGISIFQLYPWTPAVIALVVLNQWRETVSHRALVLLTCWLLVPLVVAWTTTQLHIAPLFHKRFLLASWPASILAAAACVRLGTNAATQSVIVGVILAIAVANGGLVSNWLHQGKVLNERREDWRSAVVALAAARKELPIPVLLRSRLIEADELPQRTDPLFREYCLSPVRGMYRIDGDQVYPLTTNKPGQLLPETRDALRGQDSFWLLIKEANQTQRAQLLIDLRQSIEDEQVWTVDPPLDFGNVYLQQIHLRQTSVLAD